MTDDVEICLRTAVLMAGGGWQSFVEWLVEDDKFSLIGWRRTTMTNQQQQPWREWVLQWFREVAGIGLCSGYGGKQRLVWEDRSSWWLDGSWQCGGWIMVVGTRLVGCSVFLGLKEWRVWGCKIFWLKIKCKLIYGQRENIFRLTRFFSPPKHPEMHKIYIKTNAA